MGTTHPSDRLQAGRKVAHFAAAAAVVALTACSVLQPSKTPSPSFYALGNALAVSSGSPARAPIPSTGPTLVVSPPRAAAGFDSQRIIYLRESHKLEYFANNEWIDPPARMLGPLMVSAIERVGVFRAVMLTPGSASGEMRLDTEIVRLQQEFVTQPSQAHFTLRAYVVEERTRRVLAWREFDSTVNAPSEDPYGGVLAANQAVQNVMTELAAFCADAAKLVTVAPK